MENKIYRNIQKLSENVSNKIAAGEVVEKPASVVKELIENSLDAGSTSIILEIKSAGKSLIRVTDNGYGIMPNDISLAFERHATSKVSELDDIYTLTTLGFRGEALASISSVSNVEMVTKHKNSEAGQKIVSSGGKILSVNEVGASEGTTIMVKDLFFNTPARLKFLKSNNAETSAVTELISRLALSNPDTAFKYIVDSKIVFQTSGNGKLLDAVYVVLGKDLSMNLFEVERESDFLSVKGYASKLNYTRGNRSLQICFVNGRYVKSKVVYDAVSRAYSGMLFNGKFPAVVLNIKIDPAKVDINIHPAKTEIKFSQELVIRDEIEKAVRGAINKINQAPKVDLTFKKPQYETGVNTRKENDYSVKKEESTKVNEDSKSNTFSQNTSSSSNTLSGANNVSNNIASNTYKKEPVKFDHTALSKLDINPDVLKENNLYKSAKAEEVSLDKPNTDKEMSGSNLEAAEFDVIDKSEDKTTYVPLKDTLSSTQVNEAAVLNIPGLDLGVISDFSLNIETHTQVDMDIESVIDKPMNYKETAYDNMLYRGQIFSSYLIFEKDKEMILIDQHAAHEKIMYEKFMRDFENKELVSQILVEPILISLSVEFKALVLEHMDTFSRIGYKIEEFGDAEIIIREVPILVNAPASKALFMDIVDSLTDTKDKASILKEEKIIMMSCKSAIKANDQMSEFEAKKLVEDLKLLMDPYTCPHGRPIMIKMGASEISKKFKRT